MCNKLSLRDVDWLVLCSDVGLSYVQDLVCVMCGLFSLVLCVSVGSACLQQRWLVAHFARIGPAVRGVHEPSLQGLEKDIGLKDVEKQPRKQLYGKMRLAVGGKCDDGSDDEEAPPGHT